MEVRLVDPSDDNELAEWAAVLRASDEDLWPDLTGFTLPDIRAFARHRSTSKRFDLLAAREPRRSDPRRGDDGAAAARQPRAAPKSPWRCIRPTGAAAWGRPSSKGMAEHGRSRRALVLNCHRRRATRPRRRPPLAVRSPRRSASRPCSGGNIRHLSVPIDDARVTSCAPRSRERAMPTRTASLTFEAPWPAEYLEDQCALFRCMSTDEPHGDEGHEEEIWDAERVRRERRPACRPRRPLPDCGGAARRLGPARRLHRALHRRRSRRGRPGRC